MTTRLTIGPLDDGGRANVQVLAAAASAADGVAPLSEQPLLDLSSRDPDITHVVAHDEGGGVVGYAQIDRRGPAASAELVVHPQARRHGVGRTLLRTARRDASLPSRSGEPGQHGTLRVWAHGNLAAAQALAAAESLTVVRELRRMERTLNPASSSEELPWIPSVPMVIASLGPDSLVQAFQPGRDEEAWLTLNARAFAHHPEQGRLTLADLHARMAEEWFDAQGFFVVRGGGGPGGESIADDGPLVAAVWTKITPEARRTGSTGELYVLAVDPQAQGRGWGRRLTTLALASLRASGLTTAELWTDATNLAAVATYERAGFRTAATDVQYGPAAPSDSQGPAGNATIER